MPSSALTALRKAARGLLYMSEKDAPFKTFAWQNEGPLTPEKILEWTGMPAETPVEVVDLDEFFRGHVSEQKWHGADEKAVVKKFQNLLQILHRELRQVRVYKLGRARLRVFIVGQTAEGTWAGLETSALET